MNATTRHQPWLSLLPIALMVGCGFLVVPWLLDQPQQGILVSVCSVASTLMWFLILWWALHHLVGQAAGAWARPAAAARAEGQPGVCFLVLYATRDDFSEASFLSCVNQVYPGSGFKVVVCDDSEGDDWKAKVDAACSRNPACALTRRSGRAGFKAGNLNHALTRHPVAEDAWVVLVDADQLLPERFLERLAPHAARASADVAFLQGMLVPPQASLHSEGLGLTNAQTRFQDAVAGDVTFFSTCMMSRRGQFGFLPLAGRGAAVRASVLKQAGGFPECVSEDFALSFRLAREGYRGKFVDEVESIEPAPVDFYAYCVRLRKYAAGAAELIRRHVGGFLAAPVPASAKLDACMLLGSYAVMPLLLVNLGLTHWLASIFWAAYQPLLAPGLQYVFWLMAGLQAAVFAVCSDSLSKAARHGFWSFACYNAALPQASLSFLTHLTRPADFPCTPKVAGSHPSVPMAAWVSMIIGSLLLAAAFLLRSPFGWTLGSFALAFCLCPLFHKLHEPDSWTGRVARVLAWLPGVLFLYGVFRAGLEAS